jgi:hypothetical protein
LPSPQPHEVGACAGQPELVPVFFGETHDLQERAKGICFQCPAQFECLAGALQRREPYGVWGGTSPADRRRLRQKGLAP